MNNTSMRDFIKNKYLHYFSVKYKTKIKNKYEL